MARRTTRPSACGSRKTSIACGNCWRSPGFGDGPGSLGAELEMYVVDGAGNPLYANEEILADADDPQLTLELNRYNLEFNLSPYAFSASRICCHRARNPGQAGAAWARWRRGHGGRIVPIGILPTLRQADFGTHCITQRRRYHALVDQLIRRRGDRLPYRYQWR